MSDSTELRCSRGAPASVQSVGSGVPLFRRLAADVCCDEHSWHRFELIRSSYGTGFRLVGVLKELETSPEAAIMRAVRLDNDENPQREAALLASEDKAAGASLDRARLTNKPKLRPWDEVC